MKGFIGNQRIIDLFTNLNKEDLSHAYLFYGKEGVGKKTFAKKLIQSLHCPNSKPLEPCGKCPNCLQIEKNSHADTMVLEGTDPLSIEMIRKMQHQINLKSQNHSLKTCLIDNAERMTSEAANCLLKTLEEPPANSLFILVAAKPQLLPKTILSRCQKIKFQSVPEQELKKELAILYPQFNFNEIILNYTNGAPGQAIHFLEDADFVEIFNEQKTHFEKFLQGTITERFQLNNELSRLTLKEIRNLLEIWLFFTKNDLEKNCENSTIANKFKTLAEILLEIKQKTAYNLNRRVLLDQLALRSPRL